VKGHRISTATKPHTTLKNVLVHPKDRMRDKGKAEVIYNIPCKTVTSLISDCLSFVSVFI